MLETDFHPELVAESAWVASNATVVGRVWLAAQSSVWFGAVLRGDCEEIHVGEATNVQDLCCLHGDPGFGCRVGNQVTIGHGAIVHGATIDDESLVGMRAVLLNGAKIGKHCIVGAGTLVAEGKVIPPRSLIVGSPARIVREVSDDEIAGIRKSAKHYAEAAAAFKAKGPSA